MSDRLAAFVRGDRPDDVAVYFADEYADTDSLANRGQRVDGGVAVVLAGAKGRHLFERITGLEAMAFARATGDRSGSIAAGLTAAQCPAGTGPDHGLQFLLAFVQPRTPEAGGRYAEGDVLHAYAACRCGTTFSETRVLD